MFDIIAPDALDGGRGVVDANLSTHLFDAFCHSMSRILVGGRGRRHEYIDHAMGRGIVPYLTLAPRRGSSFPCRPPTL